jgi:hypothetical protein
VFFLADDKLRRILLLLTMIDDISKQQQDKTRQDKKRQDTTRQDKTRQDKIRAASSIKTRSATGLEKKKTLTNKEEEEEAAAAAYLEPVLVKSSYLLEAPYCPPLSVRQPRVLVAPGGAAACAAAAAATA